MVNAVAPEAEGTLCLTRTMQKQLVEEKLTTAPRFGAQGSNQARVTFASRQEEVEAPIASYRVR